MKLHLLPYKLFSNSAKELQKALKERGVFCKRINKDVPKVMKSRSINWGCSEAQITGVSPINSPGAVKNASNKLIAFSLFKEHNVTTPDWTTSASDAAAWVDSGDLVFGRTKLNGHSGEGIVQFGGDNSHVVTHAPLYVKYKKKKHEFRIHVFNEKVIDVQQKKRKSGIENDSKVRNLANGWVYCRENVVIPHDAAELAVNAVKAISLTFGAVDIIFNEHENKSYVLEVNTAPGLSGETINSYANAIMEYVNAS